MHDRLPQQFQRLCLLERAARCAVGCWLGIEEGLCNGVQRARSPSQIFPDGWFGYWKVARTLLRGERRQEIHQLLFGAMPELMAPQPSASKLAQELSEEIRPMNSGRQPTCLVSKFAFSCSPPTCNVRTKPLEIRASRALALYVLKTTIFYGLRPDFPSRRSRSLQVRPPAAEASRGRRQLEVDRRLPTRA